MRKFLIWFASGLLGLLALSIAGFVMPPLSVGFWHKDWDPELLRPGQEVLDNGRPLAERWPDLPALVRGRYMLAISRFGSFEDCITRDKLGNASLRLDRMRNEFDIRVCLYLILSHHNISGSLNSILKEQMFDLHSAEFEGSDGKTRWLDFSRRFSSYRDIQRALPFFSDWTGIYLLQKTVFAWLSSSQHFDLTLRLRYIGTGDLPKRIVIDFTGISK